MDLLLVTFEIASPLARFQTINEITRHENVQLSATSFVVKVKDGNGEIFQKLQAQLGDTDSLYVMTLKKPYSGLGLKTVIDWLDDQFDRRAKVPPLPKVMNLAG